MRPSILIALSIAASFVSGSAMAAGAVQGGPYPVTAPGNSAAAHDVIPGAQTNCLGDLVSTARSTNRGDSHPGPDSHLNPTIISSLFTLGTVIGPAPFDSCGAAWQAAQP